MSTDYNIDISHLIRNLQIQTKPAVTHHDDFVDSLLRFQTLDLATNRLDFIVENQVLDSHCKPTRTQ